MKEDQNIDELFRSSFEEFGVTPPPSVKEAIDRRIVASSSGRRGLFWFLVAFVGLGLLAAFLLWPSSESAPARAALAQQEQMPGDSGSSSSSSSPSGPSAGAPGAVSSGTATDNAHHVETAASVRSSDSGTTASVHRSKRAAAPKRSSAKAKKQRNSSAGTGKSATSKSVPKSGEQTTGSGKWRRSVARQKQSGLKARNGATSKTTKKRSKTSAGTPLKNASGGSSPSGSSTGNGGTAANAANGGTASGNDGQPSGGALASGGTTPPNSVTGNPPITPANSDSTKTSLPPAGGDSTKTTPPSETPPEKPGAKKPASTTDYWWRVSLYGGPQIAFNQPRTTSDMKLTERPAFQFSAEVNRSLWNGYGVSTGFQYASRSETLNKTTTTSDSTLSWVVTPIYDQQVPDSIIGYDSVMQTQLTNTQHLYQQVNRIQSFGIPLYVTKHFEFGDNWGVLVNLGTVFQFYKVTLGATDNIPAPVVHDFSVNVVGRVHATYRFTGGWMISAGLSGGWDLKPAAVYVGMDRKRYYLTPQIGLHYSF